ncbi:hypothetical protein GCM10009557_44740 [Virgisporangium ochraceum]|uniref:Uncharacterized protein n=1 Tax=Virgisporangium ochraceum TaxID=65505 RepID=A0A8J3ZMS7_9ACTN|nr:hypothetical protein [Virgisporangium ochraceum]GIJ66932.1 hypothetical protein Voc01_018490 [Virgisporangium ochraceum]
MGNPALTDRVSVDVEHVHRGLVHLSLDLGRQGSVVERPAGGSVAVPVTCPECGADLVAEVFSVDGTRRLRRTARWLILAVVAGMVGVLLLFGLVAVGLDTAFLAILLVLVFVGLVVGALVLVMESRTPGVYGPWPRRLMSRPRLLRRGGRDHTLQVRSR